jgi:hypothetical protein
MNWRAIAAHGAIVCLAGLGGFVGSTSSGLSCFYGQWPFGSACSGVGGYRAYAESFFWTGAALYLIWGLVILIMRVAVRK